MKFIDFRSMLLNIDHIWGVDLEVAMSREDGKHAIVVYINDRKFEELFSDNQEGAEKCTERWISLGGQLRDAKKSEV